MVLMAIRGSLGAGKTLGLTYITLRNYKKGRKIYSNYNMKIPHTFIKNVKDIDKMKNGFFAADELWSWIDSQLSGKKKNRLISSILLKSRKRDIHIAYTLQHWKSIMPRIRSVTDLVLKPQLTKNEKICRLDLYTFPALQFVRKFKFYTAPIFELYDTKEEVNPLGD